MDLSMLTEEEAALFESIMGKMTFFEKKAPITPIRKKVNTLPAYVLGIKYTCLTCGSVYHTCFEMIPAADKTGLVSRKCEPDRTPDRTTERSRNVCSECRGFLLELPKEALVSRLLTALSKL